MKRWRINVFLTVGILLLASLGIHQLLQSQLRAQNEQDLRTQVIFVPKIRGHQPSLSDAPYERSIDWDALKKLNPDIIGWLYLPDTPIDYPILDGGEYEKKDEFGQPCYMGSIFVDRGTNLDEDAHVLLFGHNMRSRQMFGSLKDYVKKKDFAALHESLYLYTPKRTTEYRLIGTLLCDETDALFELHPQDDPLRQLSVQEFYRYVQKRCHASDGSESGAGAVASLSTCYGAQGTSRRLTVHFSLLRQKYVV